MVGYGLRWMSTPATGRHALRSPRWAGVAGAAGVVTLAVGVVAASNPVAVGAGVTTTTARPAATTVAPTTTTTTLPPLPPPADEASDPVRTLLPRIVAVAEVLQTPTERQPVVATTLTEGGNTVAIRATPGTLCAVVAVSAPVMAAGRWERDGEPVASAPSARRDPPGYGDCITAEDVGELEEGAYQYLAIGPTGATSAVATVVVGVPLVAVWLLNDGDRPVCLVQASPQESDFYEAYRADSELLPGEALAIRMAAVEQDVRVFGCPPDDVERGFELTPQAGVYVELFGGEEPEESTPSAPGGAATSTTSRPTTTG
jgi:hypothetical protein